MNIKQILVPIIVGTIATTLCFSFGFFTDLYEYGINFFYIYIIFTLLLCYPMNIIALYINNNHCDANTHCKLSKTLLGTSELKMFCMLFVWVIIVITSFAILNISEASINILENAISLHKPNNNLLNLSFVSVIYVVTTMVFLMTLVVYVLNSKSKLLFSRIIKLGSYLILFLIILFMLFAIYSNTSTIGINSFLLSSGSVVPNYSSMISASFLYAILSGFVSLTFYTNILGGLKYDITKIRGLSFSGIIVNIILTSVICIAIYSALASLNISSKIVPDMTTANILSILGDKSFITYSLFTTMFIVMNIVILTAGIKYTSQLRESMFAKMIFLLAPFLVTLFFIQYNVLSIVYSDIAALKLMITLVFLIDLFIIGWLYDAQKMNYEILKHTDIKLPLIFNIMIRIIMPFMCFYITILYIFELPIFWQTIASICCMIVYITLGVVFYKVFNKRKY